jgi:hypothetical protein
MVRPIDFQDNFSKTQIVEKTQQIQQAHPEMAQRAIARSAEQEAAQRPRETPPPSQGDEVIIHQDNPHSPPEQRGRKQQGEGNGEEGEEVEGEEVEGEIVPESRPLQHIDVVI